MTRNELKKIFAEELESIAPEIDLSAIGENENIQEFFDLDSMDIYNLLAALHQRLGIDIPEKDAPQMLTVAGALDYMIARLG